MCPLRQGTKTDADSVRVRIETFTVGQCYNDRPEGFQAVCGHLLRGDVLLERLRVHAAELAGVSVRRQRVVCA